MQTDGGMPTDKHSAGKESVWHLWSTMWAAKMRTTATPGTKASKNLMKLQFRKMRRLNLDSYLGGDFIFTKAFFCIFSFFYFAAF